MLAGLFLCINATGGLGERDEEGPSSTPRQIPTSVRYLRLGVSTQDDTGGIVSREGGGIAARCLLGSNYFSIS